MKSIVQLAAVMAVVFVMCGCKSNDPLAAEATTRDREAFVNEVEPLGVVKQPVTLTFVGDNPTVDLRSENHQLRDSVFRSNSGRDLELERKFARSFNVQIELTAAERPKFKLMPEAEQGEIPRKPDGSLACKTPAELKIPGADFAVVYKLVSFRMDKDKEEPGTMWSASKSEPVVTYAGEAVFRVTLVDLKKAEVVSTWLVSGRSDLTSQSTDPGMGESVAALRDASGNVARNTFYKLMEYFSPPVVIRTRGDGRFAMVDIGQDTGVWNGDAVEFYVCERKDGLVTKVPFADGKVIKLQKSYSWVEVKNYKTAGIKCNNYARLVER